MYFEVLGFIFSFLLMIVWFCAIMAAFFGPIVLTVVDLDNYRDRRPWYVYAALIFAGWVFVGPGLVSLWPYVDAMMTSAGWE